MNLDLYKHSSEDDKKQINYFLDRYRSNKLSKEDIEKTLFWKKPIMIKDFLTFDCIGTLSHMIYPVWRTALINDIFKKGSIVNEVVFTGGTGTGKTTIALLIQFINLTRVLSYRVPQFIFNVPETGILAIILINVTKTGSKLVMLESFKALLRASSLYREVRKMYLVTDFKFDNPDEAIPYYIEKDEFIHFPYNIQVYSGSNIGHTLGMNLFGAVLDEAEFRRGGIKDALELYSSVKERARGRFLDMRNWYLTLISSKRVKGGVISSYIDSLEPGDPRVRIYNKKVWEVKTFESYKKGNFSILVGNKRNPSRILTKGDDEFFKQNPDKVPDGCEVIQVPLAYKSDFESNLSRALRNLAGIVTDEREQLIDYFGCFDNWEESLLQELEVVSSLHSASPISVNVDSLFDDIKGMKYFIKRSQNSLRYIHIDLAETTEAAICMLHKELLSDGEIAYVVDFIMKITSPDRIDIEKIQDFIYDLVKKYNVRVATITADQFQSAQLLQYCIKNNLALIYTKRQSVEISLNPYLVTAQIVNKGYLRIGKAPLLRKQLSSLQIDSLGNLVTTERKDIADALCGALFAAYENRADLPTTMFSMRENSLSGEENLAEVVLHPI